MNITLTDKDGNKQYFTDITQISTTHITKEDFIHDAAELNETCCIISKQIESIVKKFINCGISSCIVDSSLTTYKLFIKNNKIYIHPSDLNHCKYFSELDLTFQLKIELALFDQLSNNK